MPKNKNINLPAMSHGHGKKATQEVQYESYLPLHPSWRFYKMKCHDLSEYGWCSLKDNLVMVMEKLHDFETMTWREIKVNAKKQHHTVPVKDLIKDAQDLLSKAKVDVDGVFSLHLTGTNRIWGIIDPLNGALEIMWWDPEHKICPSNKKHT